MREILRDPKVRRAYVLTKLAVFVVAAVATWPLSHVIGPKAWIGLGVFGALLAVLTLAVLGLGGGDPAATDRDHDRPEETAEPDPAEPVVLPVEDWIDLHSFPPRDIPAVVTDYLEAAHAAGHRVVRLIHGRGIGVQRERVRATLARHPLVASFDDAPPDRGGWGAQEATLRDAP